MQTRYIVFENGKEKASATSKQSAKDYVAIERHKGSTSDYAIQMRIEYSDGFVYNRRPRKVA